MKWLVRLLVECLVNKATSKSCKQSPRLSDVDASLDNKREEFELQVHLAEYNALTMRATYWITLQYACWPIILLFWACAAQLWKDVSHMTIIWTCACVTGLVIICWCLAGYEICNNAKYIEHELRPKIQPLVRNDHFWGYEGWLAKRRGERALWYEWGPMAGLIASLAMILVFEHPWNYGDWLGVTVYLLVLAMVWNNTKQLTRVRRSIICKSPVAH